MKIKNEKDFFAGLLFLVLGTGYAWGATGYTLGSAARMGPGYFPLLVGVLLALLGVLIMFKALVIETEGGGRVGAWAWRPLFFILGGNLLFGLLLVGLPAWHIPGMGLMVAIYALVLVAGMASREYRLRDALVLATVLAAGCYLVFVQALNMHLPVWPQFLTG
ncbi:tripartite tricarboxylate transporter TctB family protein [Comamonas sp. NLF-1-9]|uniref:tripartite tricarboxylate transporter TctB family protein n=1 Tax=Comamonas sp. NLF-1-9 TaxID=2853163 RepID=UPI001C479A43|nr:tripartite tricarboxylate transporter TctB family protein [Comamonas sp. NLF-1-9]QXL84709.1 tripartite tricarboxylate transporter TctB family protein [Comamonas sp. NLF-1-9]